MFGIKGGNHDGQHSKCRRKSYRAERSHGKKNRRKFSSIMAMVLGAIVTIEIMIMGAMVLKLDFHSADRIALALGFMVLYSGVVIALADK